MSSIRNRLVEAIAERLSLPLEDVESLIVPPRRPEHGDLAIPCFMAAKAAKKNPQVMAHELASSLVLPLGVIAAEAVGPFVNFRFDRPARAREVIHRVLEERDRCGSSARGIGKTILVDFSSPNIAKPFHVGHLRSTLIGASLCRILRHLGYDVVRINHLGDWGTQFGFVSVGCRLFGRPPDDHPDPVFALVEVYQKAQTRAKEDPEIAKEARDWFRALESGDAEARAFWEYARRVSLDAFERVYRRLGIQFDHYLGESFYNDKMDAVFAKVKDLGIGMESEGTFGIDLGEDLGFGMLQKSDGATLYLTRDLAAVFYRHDRFHFDKALYVVGAPQALHFRQLRAALEKMNCPYAQDIVHVPFGHVEGMSTRSGGAIPLEEFLAEGQRRAKLAIEEEVQRRPDDLDVAEVAERISISAIIFQDLQRGRIKDVKFDWERALSFRGDTGPYLQYAHARINGIERKAGIPVPHVFDTTVLVEDESHRLVNEIDRFVSIVERAAAEYEPSIIAQYLVDLAQAFSSANDVLRVKDQPEEIAGPRLALFDACRRVLACGLRLLGIEPVDRM